MASRLFLFTVHRLENGLVQTAFGKCDILLFRMADKTDTDSGRIVFPMNKRGVRAAFTGILNRFLQFRRTALICGQIYRRQGTVINHARLRNRNIGIFAFHNQRTQIVNFHKFKIGSGCKQILAVPGQVAQGGNIPLINF